MTPYTHAETPTPRLRARTLAACLLLVLVGLVSLAAATAPTADASGDRTYKSTLHMDDLNIYDAALTQACGFEVVAFITFDLERKLELPKPGRVAATETQKVDGTITWVARESGNTYTDKLENRSKIEYPQGIDLFAPAHVTVTGSHGGTFPVGGGPPGHGKFEYDAVIYATGDDSEPFPYFFVDSEPTWTGKSFDRATAKICAALS